MQPEPRAPPEPANDVAALVVPVAPAPGAWTRLRVWSADSVAARVLGRVRDRFVDRFVTTYLTADARSLAAGRIALASVLLLDLVKRWVQLGSWYTNDGLVPNHTLLWRPSFAHVFSFFYMASYTHEAVLGFVICALAYTALLVGLYTRAAQVLSMICVMSLHGRLLLFDNGGDVVLGLLAIWTAFLPTGGRFSIDAVLARRPARPRVVSLGVLAFTCQLAFIYFFNAVHKNGETWREGSAVHYVLHLDRLATPLAVWLRARMTPDLSRAMSWSALGMEWSLPFLLLSPFATRYCRRVAIAFVVMLHTGFGLLMNLGVFVPAMIAYAPHFLPGDDWDALARWWRRSPARARRSAALAARVAAVLRRAGAFFSLGHKVRVVPPGPAVAALRARLPLLRELAAVLFIVVAANQLLDENQAAHRVIDHHNSPPVAAAVTYLNLFQGWSMFAPEVNKTDINLAVDAVTIDGRHVDPWNEAANPRYPRPGARIPPAMGPNWLFYQYVTRLPWWPVYNQAFQEWILRYPQRTGRKDDEIVSLKVFKVEDDSPPPGQTEPTNARATLLFEYAVPTPPPVVAPARADEPARPSVLTFGDGRACPRGARGGVPRAHAHARGVDARRAPRRGRVVRAPRGRGGRARAAARGDPAPQRSPRHRELGDERLPRDDHGRVRAAPRRGPRLIRGRRPARASDRGAVRGAARRQPGLALVLVTRPAHVAARARRVGRAGFEGAAARGRGLGAVPRRVRTVPVQDQGLRRPRS